MVAERNRRHYSFVHCDVDFFSLECPSHRDARQSCRTNDDNPSTLDYYSSMIDASSAEQLIHKLLQRPAPPWRAISSRELADLLNVSLQSLANWRVRGTGPVPEKRRKGQGNRMMYRPDVVMSWLSRLGSVPREPWEFSREWLIAQGLDTLENREAQVQSLIDLMDSRGYFRNKR